LPLIIVAAHAQEVYSYDDLGRLVQVDYEDGQVVRYRYDAAGNRVLIQMGGAPVLQNDSANVAENTPQDIDVLDNDFDLNGDLLTITNISVPLNGAAQVIDVNGEQWIRYTPDVNFSGPDAFDYTVTDGLSSAVATVSIDVISSNARPIAVDDAILATEDIAIMFDPRLNDSDPEGQTLTIVTTMEPANGVVEIIANNTQLRYTPDADFNGSDAFSYTVSDGALTDTAIITVSIAAVNDAPIAVNDSMTVTEDVVKVIGPLANDTDPDNDRLTISSATNGARGVVAVINNATQLRYTPNANANGADSFNYTISDGNGGNATATVNVFIDPTPDPPIAVNDHVQTNEDTVLTINALNNDIAPDGQSFSISGRTNGSKGAVTIINNATQLRYAPNSNVNGSDSFTYTIFDGSGSDTATVHVTIAPVNDSPVALNDTFSRPEGLSAWKKLDVLANDSDLETSVTISAVNDSIGHGEVRIVDGGARVEHRCPAPCGNSADDTFTYTITDGQGGFDSAIVDVLGYSGGPF